MATKRMVEEFDVCDIKESRTTIVQLSPIKRSRKDESLKYFTGQLSDGKKCACVISFELSLRQVFIHHQMLEIVPNVTWLQHYPRKSAALVGNSVGKVMEK